MARLLTVSQVAAEVGFGKSKVWQWIKSGRLGSVKIDGARRIRQEDLAAFLDSLTDEASA